MIKLRNSKSNYFPELRCIQGLNCVVVKTTLQSTLLHQLVPIKEQCAKSYRERYLLPERVRDRAANQGVLH